MSRLLQYLNFVGVVALAVLCFIQWKQNSQANKEVITLELTRQGQITKIVDQDKVIKGNATEIDDFRQRLSKSEAALKESEVKLATMTTERNRLSGLNDQYKTTLDKWEAAVAQRDQELKRVGDQFQKLVNDRNEAVVKFNDLVVKYDAAVNEAKAARAKLASTH